MPKFAPNTGFKMPGVGSKNIDSPGNFRDEQHVDKVGYCDTTEDRMLPEGSSPLKVRYASSGYLKDLDAISIPSKKGCPKGYKAVDGKCVKTKDKPPKDKPKGKTQLKVPERKVDLPDAPSITDVPMLTNKTESTNNNRSRDTTISGYQGKKMSKEAWNALTPEKRQEMNRNVGADKSGKITTTVYKVNGKITDKAGYDAAGPSANKSKS
tara:strand:- start:45 stop:674 length:630 start_codon:yes stop_codon:yes gene_type:complete